MKESVKKVDYKGPKAPNFFLQLSRIFKKKTYLTNEFGQHRLPECTVGQPLQLSYTLLTEVHIPFKRPRIYTQWSNLTSDFFPVCLIFALKTLYGNSLHLWALYGDNFVLASFS